MRSTIEILKVAAASRTNQINSMANSIDVPVKSSSPPKGLYVKTEMQKDQLRMPADLHKIAAISPRTGLTMFTKSSKKSGLDQLGGSKVKKPEITEGNMQQQLDSSQYRFSLDRKDAMHNGFSGAVESKRAPGLIGSV